MTISEKVAYLKGLAEGLELDDKQSKEDKLISVMIGILEEVGISIDELEDNVDALGEELDAVSDDLSDVEEIVYGDEDDEEDDEDEDGGYAGHCCGRGGCHRGRGEDDEDEDFFEVECPTCGADITIDQGVLNAGTVECPSCGEKFALDLCDEEEDGDDPDQE